jgi:hypothetical protein
VTDRTDVALPTTATGWAQAINQAARELRVADGEGRSLAPMLGPEAAAALDEYLGEDAVESLGLIAETVESEAASPAAAIGAMLCAHMRIGIEFGIWLAARKGVRLP